MFAIDEKPYTEILRGRAVRKVSPKRRHGVLQYTLARLLSDASANFGTVATEWRFTMPGEPRRTTLVPDVAFVAHDRLRPLSDEDREQPPFAPEIAIEIRSPGDRTRTINEKIGIYLRHGSLSVLDVDPLERSMTCHDASGVRTLREGDIFTLPLLPKLRIDVRALFASADLPGQEGAPGTAR